MNFRLRLSSDNVTYSDIDLFPNQNLSYNAEFYDDDDINSVKIPFSSEIKIPLTASNKVFFGYNPISNNQSAFPTGDFFYKINVENSANTVMYGVCKVLSIEFNSDEPYLEVELKDFLSRFLSDLKDVYIGDVLSSSYHTTQQPFTEFLKTTSNGGEAGVINQDPNSSRIVNFPYIDFANEIEQFGYEARQFLEYGSGQERSGIVPTLSVPKYLEQVGTYLSTSQIPVRVKSKLFGINETEYDPSFEAEKLNAIIPTKLFAKNNVNTREFNIQMGEKFFGVNEDLTSEFDLDGNSKLITTPHGGSFENYGNIYATNHTSYETYGVRKAKDSSYVNVLSESGEKGYFVPHMSFTGKISYLNGNRSNATGVITVDIPLADEDKMVWRINVGNSNMTFGLYLGLYEDGFLKKKIPLEDSNGNKIVLNASNATAVRGFSDKDQNSQGTSFKYSNTNNRALINTLSNPGIYDALEFSSVDAYLPSDEELTMDFNGDSRYAISHFAEPISGDINITFVTAYQPSGGVPQEYFASSFSTQDFPVSAMRKLETEFADYSDFHVKCRATEDYGIYFDDDEYVISESLNKSNITPVDFISAICKRFGCALLYDFDGSFHNIIIDPLHIRRTITQSANDSIDDLKSIVVRRPEDAIKNLVLKNQDKGYFFDKITNDKTRGSTTQEINPDGITDLEISFESSIYFKSVCGEVFFESNSNIEEGVISSKEAGYTQNVFGKYTNLGIRFCYIDNPIVATRIKYPFIIEETVRPDLYTETQRIYRDLETHVFNGRISNKNTSGYDLLAEDADGNTTDYYDLISVTEQIKSKKNLKIEFSMIVPTSELGSVLFMLKKNTLGLINNQNVLIKSASGDVFEDNAYLDVNGIIE